MESTEPKRVPIEDSKALYDSKLREIVNRGLGHIVHQEGQTYFVPHTNYACV